MTGSFSSEGDRRFGPDVERYLSEVRTKPVLSSLEEADLAEQARAGDEEALLQWIDSYLFMTASIALRLCPPAMAPLEAIQEANAVLTRLLSDGGARSPIAELGRSIEEHFDRFHRRPPPRS
ncbi:MAG TPA: sigma-70 factor domain-containing protein [Actinomycetota bacterium]|nr:sigma-70 factor domain-containing protein [Actinomycetota bacterium]